MNKLEGKTIKEWNYYNANNGLHLKFTDGTDARFFASTNGEFEIIQREAD